MVRTTVRFLLVVFITLLATTVTKAKFTKGFFYQERADTTQLPEWYLNPPANYTQNGITHIFSTSQGMSIERALANAIVNLGLKLRRLDKSTDQDPTSYEDVFRGKTSFIVNRTIDSIYLFGNESVEWEEKSDYTDTFLRNFKITYQSGEDFYSVDLEQKEVTTGEDSNYSVKFDVQERNHGFRAFLEHISNSRKLSIKKRVTADNEYFLLLEYVKGN